MGDTLCNPFIQGTTVPCDIASLVTGTCTWKKVSKAGLCTYTELRRTRLLFVNSGFVDVLYKYTTRARAKIVVEFML